jgi:uncharacterized phosphosugar-binding protein
MNNARKQYYSYIKNLIDEIYTSQNSNIENAINAICDAIENKKSIFSFGASHAGIITQELFYRAGGLALINPIFLKETLLDVRPITQTSKMERLPGYGSVALEAYDIKKGDIIVITSVSGRNDVSIDMAIKAKEKGAIIIAITSLKYSSSVKSRHCSGKRLFELADIVIDNCGVEGDACVKLDQLKQKVSPSSTIAGAFIVNSIVAGVCEELIDRGIEPPVFYSSNVDGGDEKNKEIFKKYKKQIRYM